MKVIGKVRTGELIYTCPSDVYPGTATALQEHGNTRLLLVCKDTETMFVKTKCYLDNSCSDRVFKALYFLVYSSIVKGIEREPDAIHWKTRKRGGGEGGGESREVELKGC